uniref:Odorant binding protein 7 n=1 Tax=Hippodamia variegata TaxID=703264 RepID=A0A9E9JLR2_9CUCU|nr:odorant binding protein 7 [Hippodamia variegata]
MRSLVAVLMFFIAVCCVESAKLSFAHKNPPHPDCREHSKYITEEQVEQLNKGGYPDSPVIRQHLLCIWKEKGVMNEAGVLQPQAIKEKLGKLLPENPEAKQQVQKCVVQKEDAAATAYVFYQCVSPLLAKYNN